MRLPPKFKISLMVTLYRMICCTLRIREEGREEIDRIDASRESLIFSLWHDELFALIPVARQLRVVSIVSPSRDGDYLAKILESQHVEAVRGSSTRGGVRALLSLAHIMKKQFAHACITLDGPAGPRHEAKEGALFLANRTGARICPCRIYLKNALRIPTWDRFQIPLPFSRVTVRFGTPWEDGKIAVPNIEESTIQAAKARLENDLHALYAGIDGRGARP